MRFFSGNDGSAEGLRKMRERGIDRLVTFASYRDPVPGIATLYDSGAFTAYRLRRPFDVRAFVVGFVKVLLLDEEHETVGVVAPDVVAGGLASLALSLEWVGKMRDVARALGRPCPPIYLAVQDGMTQGDVEPHVGLFDGIFVGGSVRWKKRTTGPWWVPLGRASGKPVHVGRVGTSRDLAWAADAGADSVDSTSWAQNDTYQYVDEGRARASLLARTRKTSLKDHIGQVGPGG